MQNETDFYVRLGQFRKALNEAGLHGHYNLFQTWFGEETDQGDAVLVETRRQALLDAAKSVCGSCVHNIPLLENHPGNWIHVDADGTRGVCMCGTTIQPLIAALPAPVPKARKQREIDDLVDRFAEALRQKLHASEQKHGWSGSWKDTSWRPTLLHAIRVYLEKGDARDVAAYCAFAWHHGWSLTSEAQEDFETRAIIAEFLAKAEMLTALKRDMPGTIAPEFESALRASVDEEFPRQAEAAKVILASMGKLPTRGQTPGASAGEEKPVSSVLDALPPECREFYESLSGPDEFDFGKDK